MNKCDNEECFKALYEEDCLKEYSFGVKEWNILLVVSIILLTALGIFLLVGAKY
jgi:hypothetical protein